VSAAALGVACGARTELDHVEARDAAADAIAVDGGDATADVTFVDASDASSDVAPPPDVIDECLPDFALCTSNGECCDNECIFGECGGTVPPYGGAPPEF